MKPIEEPEIDYSKIDYVKFGYIPLCSGGPSIDPMKGVQSDTSLVIAGVLLGICIGLGVWYAAVH